MKSIERFLCETCRQQLDTAHLVYKQVPNSHDSGTCEWCERRCVVARYTIFFRGKLR